MFEYRKVLAVGSGFILCLLAGSRPTAGAEETKNKVYGELKEDQALVYLIRKGRFSGSARTLFVYADKQVVGLLDNGSYTFAYLDPGSYLFWTNWTRIRREVDLVPGRAYYFEIFSKINLLNDTEGRMLVEKVESYATPKPKELRKAEEHIRKRHGKALRREEKMEKAEVLAVAARGRPADPSGYVRLPAYTEINLELMENVTSYLNPTGDAILFRVSSDILIDDRLAIVAGTDVEFTVRHAAKGAMGGVGGDFDLIGPSVLGIDSNPVPILGRIDSTGRRRTAAATAAGVATATATAIATGGLAAIAVFFPRGKEAFLLAGEEFNVWSKEDHWVYVAETSSASAHEAALEETQQVLQLEARVMEPVRFAPHKRQRPGDLQIAFESELEIEVVRVGEIGGWKLPEPLGYRNRILKDGWVVFVFDGWSVVRYARFTDQETVLAARFQGSLVNGNSFEAEAQIPILLKGRKN